MLTLLAIIVVIIFAIISWHNLLKGVCLIIILLPSYLWRLDFFGFPSTLLELLILTLFVIWLSKNYRQINWNLNKSSINPLNSVWRYILISWLLASLIALAVNPTLAALGLWRAYWLEPLFFFLVFIYTVKNKEDYKSILLSISILLGWLGLITFYQYFTGWNLPAAYDYPNVRRLTGVYSYPNALALLAAPLSVYLGINWLASKAKAKNWWQGLAALSGLALCYFAVSEGAMIAIILALAAYWLFGNLYLKNKIIKWLFVLAMAMIIAFSNFSQSLVKQIISPRFQPPVTSLEIRSLQWQETWQLLQDHWLVGTGLAGYREAMAQYHKLNWLEIYLYPHNIFLNFWTELGLFGLLVFVWALGYLILTLIRLVNKKNQLAWPLTLAWFTWFMHGLVDVPYFKNDLSPLFFILLALTILADTALSTTTGQDKQFPKHGTGQDW